MVTNNHYRWDFVGLSTDEKPTPDTSPKVVDGSTFYCSDTSKLYVYCKNNWYERRPLGSGGGSDINVVQTTGESTTDVMSQKAVTDALASAGGPTVVQTTGTSTTDVMSQNAATSMIYQDPSTKQTIQIGDAAVSGRYSESVSIGRNAKANGTESVCIGKAAGLQTTSTENQIVAIGYGAGQNMTNVSGSVSLGAFSKATRKGEVNIGSTDTTYGYNSTNYRVLGGVHDPIDVHDAATKGYVDANASYNFYSKSVQDAFENPETTTPFPVAEYAALENVCTHLGKIHWTYYDDRGSLYNRDDAIAYDCIEGESINIYANSPLFAGTFLFEYNNGEPTVKFTLN